MRAMQAPALNTPSRLVIATRESRLALWQAHHVQALLRDLGVADVSLLGMTTQGDQILDRALSKVGGKGLFVKELEVALSEGRADLAVHSLKDVPMELPEGFILAAVMQREDPRDAFVSPRHASLADLPQGAVVGTSSLRRLVQLKAVRPDLRIEALRGNLDTRLRKLDEGQYDAIILAAAGLKRLGLADRIRTHIAPEDMLPAAGQGALGLEIRALDPALQHTVETLAHWPTWLACAAERAVSRALGGSCSMPLAAYATVESTRAETGMGTPQRLHLRSLLGHAEQTGLLRADEAAEVSSLQEAEALGLRVAQALKRQAPEGWLPHC
jgi:hydroxymethylbilane synthase